MDTRAGLSHPITDSTPSHVGDERQRAVADVAVAVQAFAEVGVGTVGVIDEHRPPANVLARYDAPVPAVLRAIPIVAHHEVVPLRDEQRSPMIVRGRGRWLAK